MYVRFNVLNTYNECGISHEQYRTELKANACNYFIDNTYKAHSNTITGIDLCSLSNY